MHVIVKTLPLHISYVRHIELVVSARVVGETRCQVFAQHESFEKELAILLLHHGESIVGAILQQCPQTAATVAEAHRHDFSHLETRVSI